MSWRYVPTDSNPADDITRGLNPTERGTGFRYNDGPKFLYESAELWPENKVKAPYEEDDVSEKKKGRWAGESQENEVLLGWKKNSSLTKLRRATAYVMQFANNARVKKEASLPECRLEPGMVFRNTGVDFLGPMSVKEKRSEVKVYGCLFTCMSTRARHLELVDDLSTDHFIMALKRFIARRGRPQSIHSDNGTNFVGAHNKLRKCIKLLDEERIQNFCAPKEIE